MIEEFGEDYAPTMPESPSPPQSPTGNMARTQKESVRSAEESDDSQGEDVSESEDELEENDEEMMDEESEKEQEVTGNAEESDLLYGSDDSESEDEDANEKERIDQVFSARLKPQGWSIFKKIRGTPGGWAFIPGSLLPDGPKSSREFKDAKSHVFKHGVEKVHYANGYAGLQEMIEWYGEDYAPTMPEPAAPRGSTGNDFRLQEENEKLADEEVDGQEDSDANEEQDDSQVEDDPESEDENEDAVLDDEDPPIASTLGRNETVLAATEMDRNDHTAASSEVADEDGPSPEAVAAAAAAADTAAAYSQRKFARGSKGAAAAAKANENYPPPAAVNSSRGSQVVAATVEDVASVGLIMNSMQQCNDQIDWLGSAAASIFNSRSEGGV